MKKIETKSWCDERERVTRKRIVEVCEGCQLQAAWLGYRRNTFTAISTLSGTVQDIRCMILEERFHRRSIRQ